MTRWVATPKDRNKFHTFVPEKKEFFTRKFSYLQQEGVGALGSLFLRGSVTVLSNRLFVSAMGHTAVMALPEFKNSVDFVAYAKLLRSGEQISHKRLTIGTNEVWPDDEYVAIGSATFALAPTDAADAYTLIFEGFYTFDSGVGYNSSSTARETIQITGVKQ